MSASNQKQILGLIAWLVVSYGASLVGAVASIQAKSFYGELLQTAMRAVLYGLMAIAAWLVWRSGGFRTHPIALSVFLGQLVVNALWSWLFFVWHLGAWAFADTVLLWILIMATLICFWRVRPLAGVLLLPYLLWVSFASALNYALWQLNPELLG